MFRRHSQQMVRELGFFRSFCGDTEVTATQAHILVELREREGLNLGQLIEAVQMDKSTGSRTVRRMVDKGWIKRIAHRGDQRHKRFGLTAAGKRQLRLVDRSSLATIDDALETLTEAEREMVQSGIALYAKALARARHGRRLPIRPMRRGDNEGIAAVIVEVLREEFGDSDEEIARLLPELPDLFAHFQRPRARYLVIVDGQHVVGGGGVAPLPGEPQVGEIQKMYLLPEARGCGRGQALLQSCLGFARDHGYAQACLDTRSAMTEAAAMYEKAGFERVDRPKGRACHAVCDLHYRVRL
ncbi:MAG: bifunctional helix-turn-helix transcriptional regulator/GNAT family N-acetyltransferase [Myxococcota bacterium]